MTHMQVDFSLSYKFTDVLYQIKSSICDISANFKLFKESGVIKHERFTEISKLDRLTYNNS